MSQESQYTPKNLLQVRNYLDQYKIFGQVVPTIQGLAKFMEVSTVTVYEWAKHNLEFANTLAILKDDQFLVLFNGGLKGELNPVITKLGLSANHGMAEKSETDLTSKGEKLDGIALKFVEPKTDS